MKSNIPLSLYIHFPWCIRKCPYCDFNSHEISQGLPEAEYVDALIDNFMQFAEVFQQRPLHTIFLGGGTPSLFSPAVLEKLFNVIHDHAHYARDIETTIEVNPGVSDCAYLKGYRHIGINRISLGAQSFQNDKLKVLGRIHLREDIERAVEKIQRAGFTNYNVDLMYGLSKQSIRDACTDLQAAIKTDATHLSWYQLTIEPNTVFYKQPPEQRPDEDKLWEMELAGKSILANAGFTQYEVSAYTRHQQACEHNLNYWRFGDYIGIGAGAHSKLTLADSRITRFWNHRLPKDYLHPEKPYIAKHRTLATAEKAFEFFMNHWRLHEPTPLFRLLERTELSKRDIRQPLAIAKSRGFVTISADKIELTQLGQRFLNDVLTIFLPESTTYLEEMA